MGTKKAEPLVRQVIPLFLRYGVKIFGRFPKELPSWGYVIAYGGGDPDGRRGRNHRHRGSRES